MPDKFKAIWVSHSSIADFLKCPRLYYLRSVYKDPKTGHKITIMTPPLALGQAVHSVIEFLSEIRQEERFKIDILGKYDEEWVKVSGEIGGFKDRQKEEEYKKRGLAMLKKIIANPGSLTNKAIKLKGDGDGFDLPYYFLSEEDNIILDGKIDWMEYLPETDSLHIIDFKTGKNEEGEDSLQLPIYYLLAKNLQNREISKISYWYLDRDEGLVEQKLPNEREAREKIYEIAKRMKLGRQIEHLKCPKGDDGCFACRPLEEVLRGKAKKVGTNGWQDIYVL